MPRLGSLALALAAIGGGAGCDDSIDLHLIAPPGETTTTIDYSCVSHVEITAIGADPVDKNTSCAQIDDGAIRSLRDHDLSGLVSVDLPRTGLRRVIVRGIRSFDDDCNSGDTNTVFYGHGEYDGEWELGIQLNHSLDCTDFVSTATAVRALLLDNLLGPAATRCAPPPDVTERVLAFNLIYPRGYGTGFDAIGIEAASGATPLLADGTGVINGPHFVGAEAPSCLALVSVDGPDNGDLYAATCVDPAVATICPGPATETMFYSNAQWDRAYQLTARDATGNTDIALGLIFDASTRQPIAGATVTRRDGRTNLGTAYLSYGAGALSPGGAATGPSGLFAIEGDAPITVLVEANGYKAGVVVVWPSVTSNASRLIPLAR